MTSKSTQTTPLRQKMIDAMIVRGFAARTQQSYLTTVKELARHYHRSPDRIDHDEIQEFFLYLAKERKLSSASCRLYLHGIQFFYRQVLQWQPFEFTIEVPRKAQRIPELLTRREVKSIIAHCANPKHRMMLVVCYGCGLRVSELVAIKVRHIDGERRLLRVDQGKGAKDRQVVISKALLDQMRRYWCDYRSVKWFFPGRTPIGPISITSAQKVFKAAKGKAEIDKVGGIHSLRHAYATHLLEAGLPVHQLQRLLGHGNIHSTLRYVHWVPNDHQQKSSTDLIAALESNHD